MLLYDEIISRTEDYIYECLNEESFIIYRERLNQQIQRMKLLIDSYQFDDTDIQNSRDILGEILLKLKEK